MDHTLRSSPAVNKDSNPGRRISGRRHSSGSRPWPLATLCALSLVLALAGCGNNPYAPGETARPNLYYALADDPKTLDPSVSYVMDELQILAMIHPCFFQYHYLKRNPFVLELALGAEMPRREPYLYTVAGKGRPVQKRGEEWTFRIKRG